MAQIQWEHKTFEEFTLNEFYRLAALRVAVFVVEQECAYQELDYKDFEAIHLAGYLDGRPVAYCRIYGQTERKIHIGRVLVEKELRGKRVAYEVMEKAHEIINSEFEHVKTIAISAQKYLKPFYQKIGYRVRGAEYLEDGLPHVEMHKAL